MDSESHSSSSVLSPASPLCNLYMEELMSTHNLTINQSCTFCHHGVVFHARGTQGSITPISRSNDGSKSVLPQWGTDYKVVKSFLERFERVLTGDLVNECHWPRLLLKATPNSNDGYYVMKQIVDPKKNWKEAKGLFAAHFGNYAYEQKLTIEYERVRQAKEESVQRYSDRFAQLVDQLTYNQDDPFVIQHYLNGLLPSVHANLLRNLEQVALSSDKEVALDSFKDVSHRVIRLEAIEQNYGARSLLFGNRNSDSGDSLQNHDGKNNNNIAQISGGKTMLISSLLLIPYNS